MLDQAAGLIPGFGLRAFQRLAKQVIAFGLHDLNGGDGLLTPVGVLEFLRGHSAGGDGDNEKYVGHSVFLSVW